MDPLTLIIGAVIGTGVLTHYGPKWIAAAKAGTAKVEAEVKTIKAASAQEVADAAIASIRWLTDKSQLERQAADVQAAMVERDKLLEHVRAHL